MRVRLALPVVVVGLLAVLAGGAEAARRGHGTHGTVRRLCEDAQVKRWPGGPLVGTVAAGRDGLVPNGPATMAGTGRPGLVTSPQPGPPGRTRRAPQAAGRGRAAPGGALG